MSEPGRDAVALGSQSERLEEKKLSELAQTREEIKGRDSHELQGYAASKGRGGREERG